ncbi:UNVERIFIED_CONTAM: hypothetical protein FKN15_048109 [Acipenser sinensis]
MNTRAVCGFQGRVKPWTPASLTRCTVPVVFISIFSLVKEEVPNAPFSASRGLLTESDSCAGDGQYCDTCRAGDSDRAHPITNAIDGTERWWQSPPLSRSLEYNEVNVTLDLGQLFHVAYVLIKFANSPRPDLWVLERSINFGDTYQPWQYFASSKRDCIERFGPRTIERITNDNDVICTSEYSRIVPLENGEIVVSLVNGRPGAMNFSYSPVLRNFTKATNIRLRFLRTNTLLGHLMGKALRDPTVTRRYYYSIKDISIGGRCVCNGHAEACDAKDPTNPYRLQCDCQHNTCGGSCDQCCPGYNQMPWKPATTDNANECEPCNCNNHSFDCYYDPEVDRRKASVDINGRYLGGGFCMECQPRVVVAFNVSSPDLFHVVFRYVNRGTTDVKGRVSVLEEGKHVLCSNCSDQSKQIIFAPGSEPSFVTVPQNSFVEPFVLNPGTWSIIIEAQGILLDFLVLLPSAYYEAPVLQLKVTEACKYKPSPEEAKKNCLLYKYLSLDGFLSAPGVDGTCRFNNHLPRRCQSETLTPRHPPMAICSGNDINVQLKITVPRPSGYVLVVEYANEDESSQTLSISVNTPGRQTQQESIILYSCKYSFLCRGVAVDSKNRVAVFGLTTEGDVQFIADRANFFLYKVYLIPHEEFTMEYVEPKMHCISTHGTFSPDSGACIHSRFQTPSQSTVLKDGLASLVPEAPLHSMESQVFSADRLEGSQQVKNQPRTAVDNPELTQLDGSQNAVVYSTRVQTLGRYTFILHFYQPNHPTFPVQVYLNGGRIWQGEANATFCPHGFGCRSLMISENQIILDVTDNEVFITIKVPRGKTVWLDYVLVVPEASYSSNYLVEEPLDKSYDFISHCGANSFYIKCKDKIIGRQCDRCAAGFYGYPNCRQCECSKAGTEDDICDSVTGQCHCKENVEGPRCGQCRVGTFHLDPANPKGCTSCFCFGATDRCRSSDKHRTQTVDMNGWVLLSGERQELAVSVSPERGLVEADLRDVPDVYQELHWHAPQSYHGDRVSSYGGFLRYRLHSQSLPIRGDVAPPPLESARPDVILKGNKMTLVYQDKRYPDPGQLHEGNVHLIEGNFRHAQTRNSVSREELMMVLVGLEVLQIRALHSQSSVSVSLERVVLEGASQATSGSAASNVEICMCPANYRGDSCQELMMVLVGLEVLQIRALHSQSSVSVSLERVVLEGASQATSGSAASNVEICMCPANYRGDSCQECAPGFYRDTKGLFLGKCVPCNCNGHSDECLPGSGICVNCQHNTEGNHCETCRNGFLGNSTAGQTQSCTGCPCPLQVSSNNFAIGCVERSSSMQCLCMPGYAGPKCERCAPGFYGNPMVIGSSCQPCQCNGNTDANMLFSDCDSLMGVCIGCMHNTAGPHCEICAPGYFGDAIIAKNCTNCNCSPCGTASCDPRTGQCQCKPGVTGARCDRCKDGFYGYDSCAGCQRCDCDSAAALTQACNPQNGQCSCQPGVSGPQCLQCAPGFWGYTSDGCTRCDCKGGSCNPRSGECTCSDGLTGKQCDSCLQKLAVPVVNGQGSLNCQRCDCKGGSCNPRSGECTCSDGLTGKQCDSCLQKLAVPVDVLDDNKQKVDELENEDMNLSQDLDMLEERAVLANRKVHKLEDSIAATRQRAEDLIKHIRDIMKAVQDGIGLVNKTSANETHSTEDLRKKLSEVETLLRQMRDRAFCNQTKLAEDELKKANDLLGRVDNDMAKRSKENNGLVDDIRDQLTKYNTELMDLRDALNEAVNQTAQVVDLNNRNENLLDESRKKNSDLQQALAEVKDLLTMAEDALFQVTDLLQMLEDSKEDYEKLAANLDGARKRLLEKVQKFALASTKIPLVEEAERHAELLHQLSKNLSSVIQDTNQDGFIQRAINASNAYSSIIEAVRNAENAAKKADEAATNALENVKNEDLGEEADRLKKKSNALLEDAKNVQTSLNDLKPQLKEAKKRLQDAKDKKEQLLKDLKDAQSMLNIDKGNTEENIKNTKAAAEDAKMKAENVERTLNPIKEKLDQWKDQYGNSSGTNEDFKNAFKDANYVYGEGNTEENIKNAKAAAEDAKTKAENVERTLNPIKEKLDQWKDQYGNSSGTNEDFKNAFKDANSSVLSLGDTIPLLIKKLDKLQSRSTQMPNISENIERIRDLISQARNAAILSLGDTIPLLIKKLDKLQSRSTQMPNISENIERIRDLISQARNAASKVSVPMKFDGTSGVQLRNPNNLLDVAPYTSLKFYISLLEGKKKRQTESEKQFVFYLGNKDATKGFLGMSIEGKKLKWFFNVGGQTAELLNEQTISTDAFNMIKLERILQYGQMSVTVDKTTSLVTKGNTVAGGDEGLLKLTPSDTVFYVGGYPPDFLGHFICIAVKDGDLKLYYDFNGELKEAPTPNTDLKISDAKSKGIQIILREPNGNMKVYVRLERKMAFNVEHSGSPLNFNSVYYIGGVPEEILPNKLKPLFPNGGSIKGCVRSIKAIDKYIDLKRMNTTGVSHGCSPDFLVARTARFTGNGYLDLSLDNVPSLLDNFYSGFGFRTSQSNGLLFYHKTTVGHCQVLLENSRLVVNSNSGAIKTKNLYSDDMNHYVALYVNKNGVRLYVDNILEGSSAGRRKRHPREVVLEKFYLGGAPDATLGSNLTGCISNMFVKSNGYLDLSLDNVPSLLDNFYSGFGFRTSQSNGLLFYHKTTVGHCQVLLENSRLVVNSNSGAIKTKNLYSDDMNHYVALYVNKNGVRLYVDNILEGSSAGRRKRHPREVVLEKFYLGGAPDATLGSNLTGCISNMFVKRENNEQMVVDFLQSSLVQVSLNCPSSREPQQIRALAKKNKNDEQMVVDFLQSSLVQVSLNCPSSREPQQIRVLVKKNKMRSKATLKASRNRIVERSCRSKQPKIISGAFQFSGLGTSRLEFNNVPESFRDRSHFSMDVRLNSSSGLLFYVSNEKENSLMALSVSSGRLVLLVSIAGKKLKTRSREKYNDGQWHTVFFSREKNRVHLVTDGLKAQTMALSVSSGRLVLLVSIAGKKLKTRSREKYNDGQWHTVFFSREKNRVHLVTDGLKAQTGTLSSTGQLLVNPPFYVGGVPAGKGRTLTTERSVSGFVGCIKNLKLDSKSLDPPSSTFGVGPCSESSLEDGVYFAAGGGHLALDNSFAVSQDFEMMLEVRPVTDTGLLFHIGRKRHYLTLYAENGEVTVKVNNGGGEFSASVTPEQSLCNGRWHHIAVIKRNNVIQLDVDTEGKHAVGPTWPHSSSTKEMAYLGGVPDTVDLPGLSSPRPSFYGCVRNLIINQSPEHLSQAGFIYGAVGVGGCPVM